MRKTLSIAIVFLIIAGGLTFFNATTPQTASAYTPHDPISIEGDVDFAAQAQSEGWPGDGSEVDPYIIEGYEINSTSWDAIEIDSTNVYFVIRDVKIGSGGIFFYNVQKAIITD